MEAEDTKIHEPDLLHPELFTKEGIILILAKRDVNTSGFEDYSKEKLVEIYYRHVMPMPQRSYRSNRRGRRMAEEQEASSRRKRTHQQMEEGQSFQIKSEDSTAPMKKSGLVTSFNLPSSNIDRLKPPPTAVNFERKVVKLGASNTDNSLNRVKPVQVKDSNGKQAVSCDRKASVGETVVKSPHTAKLTSPSTKMRLKRPNSMDTNDKETVEMTEVKSPEVKEITATTETSKDEEVVAKKFKRVNIQWP